MVYTSYSTRFFTTDLLLSQLFPTRDLLTNIDQVQAMQQGIQAMQQGIQAMQQGIQAMQQGIQAMQQGIQAMHKEVQAIHTKNTSHCPSVFTMEDLIFNQCLRTCENTSHRGEKYKPLHYSIY